MPGDRGNNFRGEWKVIKEGPIHSGEGNFDLLQISFKIAAKPWLFGTDSSTLGSGTFGNVFNGSITELKPLSDSLETPRIRGGLQVKGKYAIKLIEKETLDNVKNEFDLMEKAYMENPNLFLRPHLLLQKDEDSLAIVMELGGESLDDYLGKGTEPFTIQDLKRHIGDLAVAISTIHSMGCIHRDLKPENILLVDKNGHLHLKVMDFGLMAETEHEDNNPLLCCVSKKGSLGWMQPESIENRQPVRGYTGRAYDWWSFGLIILQLVGYFGKGERAQVPVYYSDEMNGLFERLYEHYSKIFKRSNQKRRLTEIASGCAFYGGHPEDRQDLVKFAFYFLDPYSSTRPFLHLKDDTMTAKFETREEGERAKQLQGLVNKLFPKYGIKSEVTSGDLTTTE